MSERLDASAELGLRRRPRWSCWVETLGWRTRRLRRGWWAVVASTGASLALIASATPAAGATEYRFSTRCRDNRYISSVGFHRQRDGYWVISLHSNTKGRYRTRYEPLQAWHRIWNHCWPSSMPYPIPF